jgi:hypothetical protein
MLLTENITILLLSLRFSEILAAEEKKQVFVYLVAVLLEIIENSQYQDGYEPLTADGDLTKSRFNEI